MITLAFRQRFLFSLFARAEHLAGIENSGRMHSKLDNYCKYTKIAWVNRSFLMSI